MTYKPGPESKKEKVLSLILALVAVSLIVLSGITERFGGLYQISAIIFAVISIELYIKYVGSDYVYDAADDYFKVYKVTGKKSICVSSLDYEKSLSHVVDFKDFEADKQSFPKTNFNVNMCKNIAPSRYSVYFFEFNDKKCMMKFEPDEAFTEYMNKKISDAWERAQGNEEEDY